MRTRILGVFAALAVALSAGAQSTEALTAVATRDQKIVKRWTLPGDPRGVAVGKDGTVYVGLAQPQAVVAIDPKTGAIKRRAVLDSAEIASTKELVTLRTNPERTRLYIANGSDESATILSLPDLGVIREITMEGEAIRDVLPDPSGRFLYLLGRDVHVFDIDGGTNLRTIELEHASGQPMAITTTANGALLAVIATEDYGNAKATAVAIYDAANNFAEVTREPLQTDKAVEGAFFAANDRALVAFGRDALYEKPVVSRPAKTLQGGTNGQMRVAFDFGDFVNSDRVCLPEGSGPQIAVTGATSDQLFYVERRCSSGATFSGSQRRVTPASLYGVNAYALAYDASTNTLAATDRAGFLTIYKVPRPAVVK
ncbi:MAG TPA: hypothetical protein VGF69_03375 [Thermoanaerobaculia bacterium]|jgi:outer membrane protein assembly factor BamB